MNFQIPRRRALLLYRSMAGYSCSINAEAFHAGCPLQREIMRRYLHNEHSSYSSPSVDEFGQWQLIELMKWDSTSK
jgi:hypothetical protein